MEPGFVEELLLAKAAHSDAELFAQDTKELKDRKLRQRIMRRKSELAKWRAAFKENTS
jgi:hypothetical protein